MHARRHGSAHVGPVTYVAPSSQQFATSPLWFGRAAIIAAAEEIIARRLWCVVEACVDVPRQRWEPRMIVLRRDGVAVAEAVADWTRSVPDQDVRLTGCRRTDLRMIPDAPTHLCYVAGADRRERP
jgi:hypothetical protein